LEAIGKRSNLRKLYPENGDLADAEEGLPSVSDYFGVEPSICLDNYYCPQ
jgi:hypothetical protein